MPTPAIRVIVLIALQSLVCTQAIGTSSKVTTRKSLRVGLVFDLTGKREPAIDVVKGIEFAAKKLSSEGIDVQIVKYNSNSDAIGTRSAMLDVLKDPPDVIIAEVDSSKAAVAASMAEEAKRVLITPYATSPVVTEGKAFVFRACFSDNFQGLQLAAFARVNLKASKAVIFSDGGQLYSKTLAEAFRENFVRAGGEIVYEEKIASSSPSFKEQLDKASTLKSDIVFLPVYEQTAARFINEAVVRGMSGVSFLGGDGWGASRTFQDIVFRKNAPVQAYWVSHYSGDFADGSLAATAKEYSASSKQELNASAAIGYDTMIVAGRAFAQAGSAPTQTSIKEALHKMPPYSGLTGTIQYGQGQDPQKSVFIRKVDHDKMGFVAEMKP